MGVPLGMQTSTFLVSTIPEDLFSEPQGISKPADNVMNFGSDGAVQG